MFTKRATISVIPPQPKSDISDLGHLRVPNSGKPEFGWGGIKPVAYLQIIVNGVVLARSMRA